MDGDLFEWNARKAASNLHKHHVGFEEASTVFGDPLSVTISDPEHSFDEDRFIIVGLSSSGRILVVVHAVENERVRLISARKATKNEKRAYEKAHF